MTVVGAPGAVLSSTATTDGAFESTGVSATGAFELESGDVAGEATIGFKDTLGFTAPLGFEVPLLPLLLVAVTVNV